jgi:hypothetical protein
MEGLFWYPLHKMIDNYFEMYYSYDFIMYYK